MSEHSHTKRCKKGTQTHRTYPHVQLYICTLVQSMWYTSIHAHMCLHIAVHILMDPHKHTEPRRTRRTYATHTQGSWLHISMYTDVAILLLVQENTRTHKHNDQISTAYWYNTHTHLITLTLTSLLCSSGAQQAGCRLLHWPPAVDLGLS